MIEYTTWVKEYRDGPFDVKVGYFPEDTYIYDHFDQNEEDLDAMAHKINTGQLDWFVARVQYLYDGIEMGWDFLGGNLYEDAEMAINTSALDGYLDDMLREAREMAQSRTQKLYSKLKHDFEAEKEEAL